MGAMPLWVLPFQKAVPNCDSNDTQRRGAQTVKDLDMAAFDTTRTTYGAPGLTGRSGAVFSTVFGGFAAWADAKATRKALNALTDRELEDIGVVRGEIELIATGRRAR